MHLLTMRLLTACFQCTTIATTSAFADNENAHPRSFVPAGVVAVAVFGLYGAATNKWEMSAKIEQAGVFDGFWDTLAYITNAIVFFYSGVACINFLVR